MIDSTMHRMAVRPVWSAEEASLADALGAGLGESTPRPLPDPEAVYLLSLALGVEAEDCRSLPVRILLIPTTLTFLGSLPVSLWLVLRWEEITGGLPAPSESTFLTALVQRLGEAGAPGWEAAAVLLGALAFLYLDRLLEALRNE